MTTLNSLYSPSKFAAIALAIVLALSPIAAISFSAKWRHKTLAVPAAPVLSNLDLNSSTLSVGAQRLAKQLGLIPSFTRLEQLRKQVQLSKGEKLPLEVRQDLLEVKQEIMEKIEQTRLDIEFVQAGLSVEIAIQDELLHAFEADRDKRMNANYLWSFRTNGALWAVAEGLDIPTYNHPRYSIPSGTIGIVAGLIPSIFSIVAIREAKGGRYEREARPNILSKIFDYPPPPEMDFPKSVWTWVNTPIANGVSTKSRLGELIDRWTEDKYMQMFSDRNSRAQLDIITGAVRSRLTLQLISDRLAMLRQVSAMIAMMNRPLLELMMVVRGEKSTGLLKESE